MTYQTEPVSMWFDRRLVVRSSSIQGYGLFATEPIRAGEELIWVSGGIVYTTEEWKMGKVKLAPELYNETQVDDDLFGATPNRCITTLIIHATQTFSTAWHGGILKQMKK